MCGELRDRPRSYPRILAGAIGYNGAFLIAAMVSGGLLALTSLFLIHVYLTPVEAVSVAEAETGSNVVDDIGYYWQSAAGYLLLFVVSAWAYLREW